MTAQYVLKSNRSERGEVPLIERFEGLYKDRNSLCSLIIQYDIVLSSLPNVRHFGF